MPPPAKCWTAKAATAMAATTPNTFTQRGIAAGRLFFASAVRSESESERTSIA